MGVRGIEIKNVTDVRVVLQEGVSGVFSRKAVIEKKKSYTLKIDPNATYREYVLISLPDNNLLEPVLSSDDVIEYSLITIKHSNAGNLTWEGSNSEPSNSEPSKKWWTEFIKSLRTGNSSSS